MFTGVNRAVDDAIAHASEDISHNQIVQVLDWLVWRTTLGRLTQVVFSEQIKIILVGLGLFMSILLGKIVDIVMATMTPYESLLFLIKLVTVVMICIIAIHVMQYAMAFIISVKTHNVREHPMYSAIDEEAEARYILDQAVKKKKWRAEMKEAELLV